MRHSWPTSRSCRRTTASPFASTGWHAATPCPASPSAYHSAPEAIALFNHLKNVRALRVNTELAIPVQPARAGTAVAQTDGGESGGGALERQVARARARGVTVPSPEEEIPAGTQTRKSLACGRGEDGDRGWQAPRQLRRPERRLPVDHCFPLRRLGGGLEAVEPLRRGWDGARAVYKSARWWRCGPRWACRCRRPRRRPHPSSRRKRWRCSLRRPHRPPPPHPSPPPPPRHYGCHRRSGPRPTTHQLAAGETLWSVAQRYGVSVDDLKRWNRITRAKALRAGTTLSLVAP